MSEKSYKATSDGRIIRQTWWRLFTETTILSVYVVVRVVFCSGNRLVT
jgi:hypothetical protein